MRGLITVILSQMQLCKEVMQYSNAAGFTQRTDAVINIIFELKITDCMKG